MEAEAKTLTPVMAAETSVTTMVETTDAANAAEMMEKENKKETTMV